jgi:hypothetical protein
MDQYTILIIIVVGVLLFYKMYFLKQKPFGDTMFTFIIVSIALLYLIFFGKRLPTTSNKQQQQQQQHMG